MPVDKSKLGTRYTCFACGTKFYDLNRPVPTCPECSADQNEAPAQDLKSMLARNRRAAAEAAAAEAAEAEAEAKLKAASSEDDEDEKDAEEQDDLFDSNDDDDEEADE